MGFVVDCCLSVLSVFVARKCYFTLSLSQACSLAIALGAPMIAAALDSLEPTPVPVANSTVGFREPVRIGSPLRSQPMPEVPEFKEDAVMKSPEPGSDPQPDLSALPKTETTEMKSEPPTIQVPPGPSPRDSQPPKHQANGTDVDVGTKTEIQALRPMADTPSLEAKGAKDLPHSKQESQGGWSSAEPSENLENDDGDLSGTLAAPSQPLFAPLKPVTVCTVQGSTGYLYSGWGVTQPIAAQYAYNFCGNYESFCLLRYCQ